MLLACLLHIRTSGKDPLQNFVPVSNFSTHLKQINPSLWETPNSGRKGKIYHEAQGLS